MAGFAATLHHADGSSTDAYGNRVPSFTEVPLRHVVFWQSSTAEVTAEHLDIATTVGQALLPRGTVVSELDELSVDGVRWRIVGHPENLRSPFTSSLKPGVLVNLRRIS